MSEPVTKEQLLEWAQHLESYKYDGCPAPKIAAHLREQAKWMEMVSSVGGLTATASVPLEVAQKLADACEGALQDCPSSMRCTLRAALAAYKPY